MSRVLHFFSNVRGIYWLQLIWIGYVLFVNISADLLLGVWPYTFCALVVPFLLLFFARNFLVEHFSRVVLIINGMIVAWIGLVYFVIPREFFHTLSGRFSAALFLGVFLVVLRSPDHDAPTRSRMN